MMYLDSYLQLRELLKSDSPCIRFDDLAIYRREFHSRSHHLLPGADSYECNMHNEKFKAGETVIHDIGHIDDMIHIPDNEILENKYFDYHIFMPASTTRSERAVFILNGFNEKNWDKYLPWAHFLTERLQCAVILFPIAFHMNRTLSIWSDKKKMYQLCEKRKKMFPDVMNSSLTNVAISMRLHSRPQRFIWSGLQTYYDMIQFLEECKAGAHKFISPTAEFHFVAYSIGCLLGEILKLANYNGYFTDSKLCLFCGGAVFNRLSPCSKYILDSEASVALYSYMIEHFEKHLAKDPRLKHYIDGPHPEGRIFLSMLDYKVNREFREELFSKVSTNLVAITLKQDSIIPPYEIINTLQGAARDIPVPVDIFDFPYPYNHIAPFPAKEKDRESIDENFKLIFNRIAAFIEG